MTKKIFFSYATNAFGLSREARGAYRNSMVEVVTTLGKVYNADLVSDVGRGNVDYGVDDMKYDIRRCEGLLMFNDENSWRKLCAAFLPVPGSDAEGFTLPENSGQDEEYNFAEGESKPIGRLRMEDYNEARKGVTGWPEIEFTEKRGRHHFEVFTLRPRC